MMHSAECIGHGVYIMGSKSQVTGHKPQIKGCGSQAPWQANGFFWSLRLETCDNGLKENRK